MKIAVIGGGTSGLAASAFLARDGHAVTLFERFAQPHPLGAGLMLQPTGLACLAALGLADKALAAGARINNLYGRADNGRVIFDLRYRDLRPGLFGLGIHRGALFGLLYEEVRRLGVPIWTSCTIVETHLEAERRFLEDSDGTRHGPFDFVADASGMRSPLRERHGAVCYNKPYPYGAVWGVCSDPGQAFGRDYLQQRYDGAGVMIGMLAIGRQPMDGQEALTFFWSLPVNTYDALRAAGIEAWRSRVTGYWPELAPFVAQFRSFDDLTFAQYSDTIMKRWNYDRLVFIGDAAHCTSPQLGQGANLGLIDGLTLAACLKDTANVNEALRNYSEARRSHTVFYQLASRWLTPFFQSDSRMAAWVRDRSFHSMSRIPFVRTQMLRILSGLKTGPFTHLNPGRWHADYDMKKKISGR